MHFTNNHGDQVLGSTIGAVLVTIKSLLSTSSLSWSVLTDTVVLAAVGALTGFLVTTLLRIVKRKIFKS